MRDYLKNLRISKDFTQKEVAEGLDISESYYNLIENGERKKELSISFIIKLAGLFNVSITDLINQEQRWSQSAGG